jgi:hypothetical protein
MHRRQPVVLDVHAVLQRELRRGRVRSSEPVVPNVGQYLLDERRMLLETVSQRNL